MFLRHRQLGMGPEQIGYLLHHPGDAVLDRQDRGLGSPARDRGEGRSESCKAESLGQGKELLGGLVGIGPGFALVCDRPPRRGTSADLLVDGVETQDPSPCSPTTSTAPLAAVPT